MKLTIVGAGSSYTPELIEEMILRRDSLPVSELVLYDINEKRLEIMTGFCRRFADKRGMQGLKIRTTLSMEGALEGADFVDTQVRVGGNRQRGEQHQPALLQRKAQDAFKHGWAP